MPAALAELTITLNYNDLDQVRDTFARHGAEIACVIVEPIAGNMGVVPPAPGYLEAVRELTRKEKALAEAAALLVLQKKYQALWEEKDE